MQSETIIPLFPLGLVLLPQLPLPLHIFEERYKLMIGECLEKNTAFGIVFFNGIDIQTIGSTAIILKVIKRYHDGRMDILTHGQERFVVKDIYDRKPYLEGRVTFFDDEPEENTDACQELCRRGMALLKQFSTIAEIQDGFNFNEKRDAKSISFMIAGCDGFSKEEKQRFLEMTSTYKRLKKSVAALESIIERAKITSKIQQIIGGNGDMAKLSSKSIKIR
ncbi:MAG: LON peptidase substrate-binding domain-containing protein [Desulfobacterales bacterium]|jgi:Lon protease-like protein